MTLLHVLLIKAFAADAFHEHLNAQNPPLQFTIKHDHSNGMTFLDNLNKCKMTVRLIYQYVEYKLGSKACNYRVLKSNEYPKEFLKTQIKGKCAKIVS